MHYFLDFDRTIFDTESFKRAFAERPPIRVVFRQFFEAAREFFSPTRSLSKRRIFMRSFGTYVSHGRFNFLPNELKEYLYPDAVTFLSAHGTETTIVTYGVRAFITAKVANALTDLPLNDVVYTHRKKGRTIRRLCRGYEGPFAFIDDAHFQLESVSRTCPDVQVIEIRRDNRAGSGRWPVIHSFNELSNVTANPFPQS